MNTHLDKRQRVMGRSIKLGHCVCNPRQPCPCPLFKEQDICTCAGEHARPTHPAQQVRLTQITRNAGCASKISQQDLHTVLSRLPVIRDPRLLVGMATADDAGVFQLTDGINLVQTVDVFTPTVDDPYLFGRIAACNALSDVYAMGGKPVSALSIIGFPIHTLPHEVMVEILRGGMAALAEADTLLLGGHSLNDEEIKFGFAVTGLVEQKHLTTNAGARPGDLLVLTKPLGTGIIAFAGQIGRAPAQALQAAADSMSALNRKPAEIMLRHGAHACTDVTGFGLLGHLARMVKESGVTAEVWSRSLPLLPEIRDLIREGIFSGANERNAAYCESLTQFAAGVSETMRAVLYDPQTSGGLLIAFPPASAPAALDALRQAGVIQAAIIGRITETSEGRMRIITGPADHQGPVNPPGHHEQPPIQKETPMAHPNEHASECCAHGTAASEPSLKLFQDFMASTLKPGAIDVVTKELIAIALGLAVNCAPCSKAHIQKALGLGIGKAEIEEAAALAVAFGGCRVIMLWKQLEKELLSDKG